VIGNPENAESAAESIDWQQGQNVANSLSSGLLAA
jgi:hypothetical protein